MASNPTPQSPRPERGTATTAPAAPTGWLARNLTTMILVVMGAAILGYLLKGSTDPADDLVNILKVVFGLGLVIFIHELGHFLAAKWCDVYVQTFSIGFGPPFLGLCSYKWGETTYKVGWIPLGGYVKMMGEGEENEENADDPRSYKNKKVWQRMIIISAGVVMNMFLAWVCYLGVYLTHGVDQNPGVVGSVAPGGPAWQKGLRPGAYIRRIGNKVDPTYDELKREVMRSGKDNPLDLEFETYSGTAAQPHRTVIAPARSDEILAPMLLVRSANTLTFVHKAPDLKVPAIPGSPASRAEPPLQFDDRVIAATDPEAPDKITPLRADPRRPGSGALDYYDLDNRLQRLAGRPVVLRVVREGAAAPIDVKLEASFARTAGLRMQMGQIVALRDESPAATAGLHVRDGKTEGDILEAVELTGADGKPVRYSANPSAGDQPLDPMRLPIQLGLWAREKPRDYTVKLTVSRREGHSTASRTLSMVWDRNWDLFDNSPYPGWTPESPLSLSGLGLAYQVQSKIAGIEPGSPAAGTSLKPGDVVTAVSFKVEARPKSETVRRDVKEDEWAYYGSFLQETEQITEVVLTVNNDEKVTLTTVEDRSLPLVERGLLFDSEKRSEKADGFVDAVRLSGRMVLIKMMTIYENLAGLIRGRLSFKAVSGPITIAKHSFDLAGRDTFEFILFIAFININLAVVNFLPIPVLDGGHMVFLCYELLRGKPPSDRWRFILTIVGLVVVLGLMLLGLALDFGRFLLEPLKRLVGM